MGSYSKILFSNFRQSFWVAIMFGFVKSVQNQSNKLKNAVVKLINKNKAIFAVPNIFISVKNLGKYTVSFVHLGQFCLNCIYGSYVTTLQQTTEHLQSNRFTCGSFPLKPQSCSVGCSSAPLDSLEVRISQWLFYYGVTVGKGAINTPHSVCSGLLNPVVETI